MTREQRFGILEQHVERLLNLGRIFVQHGWELVGVVEMARDAEVEIDVRWNARGWWIVLQ